MQEKFEDSMQELREKRLGLAGVRLKTREKFRENFDRVNGFYRTYLSDVIDGKYDGAPMVFFRNMRKIIEEQLEMARVCDRGYREFCSVSTSCNNSHPSYVEFENTAIAAIQTLDNKIQERIQSRFGGSSN